MLRKGIASNTNNFEYVQEQLAYAVWVVEKEFHVGMVDENFPLMKFWNLFDEKNIDRYKKETEKSMRSDKITMR